MAPLFLFIVLAAIAPLSQCHYTFVRLKTEGEWKAPLQYIRNKTSPYDEQAFYESNFLYRYFNWPTYIVDRNESVRCGRGNMDHANVTEVLTVKAGAEIEIAQQRADPSEWTDDMFFDCADDRGTCFHEEGWHQDFNHPGPLIVHLSKVPDGQDIRTYDGTGEWIKIHTVGLNSTGDQPHWILFTDNPPHLTFKIPSQTPAGQYLMRMDVIWAGATNEYTKIGDPGSLAQMYPSCAQLNIVSDSQTPLPKGVKIPEIFAPDMPGMTTSWEMMNGQELDDEYMYPGGPLWDGEKLIVDKPAVV